MKYWMVDGQLASDMIYNARNPYRASWLNSCVHSPKGSNLGRLTVTELQGCGRILRPHEKLSRLKQVVPATKIGLYFGVLVTATSHSKPDL